MIKAEFISRLKDELELEAEISNETELKKLEEWDSMCAMVLIGFVSENFDFTLTAEDIREMSTIDSLIQKIGINKIK